MARIRSRVVETESVNQRMLRRGAVKRQHIGRWAVGSAELAPGIIAETHLGPRIINETHIHPDTVADLRGAAQLLVMTATADSIDDGGDYVEFDAIVAQHRFADVTVASDSFIHPVDAVYVLDYEQVWDTYEGGGRIELELDGAVATERVIASGDTGSRGRATIFYLATAGAVGKIKVTQESGSAKTCDATLQIAVSDPTEAQPSGFANVILFIDGVQVASASGDVGASFAAATMLIGQGTANAPASDFYYDEAKITRLGVNLISNGGFESAVLTAGTSTAVATGNWRPYRQATPNPAVVGTPVQAGSGAGRVEVPGGTGTDNRYFLQDVAIAPGEEFDVEAQVYPVAGTQFFGLLLDWDRTLGSVSGTVAVEMSPTATTFSAFGLSGAGPAVPVGEWTHVLLRIQVTA